MDTSLPIFLDEVPTYEVRHGQMHIRYDALEIVLPVNIMLQGMARAKRAIDDWQLNDAEVVQFRR